MEQIRTIKEMREADVRRGCTGKFIRPRFMVWENVPGTFSSNKGNDFRAVLEETIRVAEPDAPDVPLLKKWPMADAYYGDGWSIAYRVFDSKFWGVPQRRRRIALVADFGGHAAPEILFVRKSVCWDSEQSAAAGEAVAVGTGSGAYSAVTRDLTAEEALTFQNTGKGWWNQSPIGATLRTTCGGDSTKANLVVAGFNPQARASANSIGYKTELSPTIDTGSPHAVFDARENGADCTVAGFKAGNGAKANGIGYQKETSPTLSAVNSGTNQVPAAIVMATGQASAEILNDLCPTLNCDHEQPIVTDVDCRNGTESPDVIATLQAHNSGGFSINSQHPVRIGGQVRRLTPLECERLQGYPDGWTDIGPWTDSAGKLHKESSDSARYKALGNSIALPPWAWVLKRLCACYERTATMASLFDGIGGFPLIWERLNGPGSCLWASEIEEFPIAVTKRRFGG